MNKVNYEQMDEDTKKIYLKKARDQYLATSFLLGGTRSKYSLLIADLQNSCILGEDKYPKDLEEVYNMVLSYSPLVGTNNSNERTKKELYTTGISFIKQMIKIRQ